MSGEPARPGRRRLLVAYDGTPFAGWQVQPGRPTVQGALEEALGRLLGQPVRVVGSGRTDAGVHALGQVAHVDDPVGWPAPRLLGALNATLPGAIRVRAVEAVDERFHALHAAVRKSYLYQLHLSPAPGGRRAVEASVPPHLRTTCLAVPDRIEVRAMRAAAARLVGRHDFTTFSKAMPPGRGTVKSLHALRVVGVPHGLRIVATADGFLYGMVRMLCGALVEAGLGKTTPEDLAGRLAASDRARSPPSLPARGLFLWRVDYALAGAAVERRPG